MKKRRKKRVLIFDEEGLTLLAQSLKKIRKEKGYSQERLADESGLTLSQIARIETVETNPTVSTIFAIARALRVPASVFLDFRLDKKEPK